MTATKAQHNGPARLIDTVEQVEHSSLESVRKFVDTVNDAFPELGDDAPRRKIIDSAFKMTEKLVGASNTFARNILDVTEKALEGPKTASSSK